MICPCHEPIVFGHDLECPLRPEARPACAWPCAPDTCWNRCSAWRAQARAFGWPVPESRGVVEEALAVVATLGTFNPLDVRCGYCRAPAGTSCGVRGFGTWRARPAVRPHKRRVRLALALAAAADRALDAFFPIRSQCGICGVPGMPQRHRQVDGIAGMLTAGEDPDVTAEEHGTTTEAVAVVQAWMTRWPGAWT